MGIKQNWQKKLHRWIGKSSVITRSCSINSFFLPVFILFHCSLPICVKSWSINLKLHHMDYMLATFNDRECSSHDINLIICYFLYTFVIFISGDSIVRLRSARAVNRRYISDCVPLKLQMQASAGFVTASALGMACGPALACLSQTHFKVYRIIFNEDTLPGWVMAMAWLIYLLWLWFSFREPPPHEPKNKTVFHEPNAGMQITYLSLWCW